MILKSLKYPSQLWRVPRTVVQHSEALHSHKPVPISRVATSVLSLYTLLFNRLSSRSHLIPVWQPYLVPGDISYILTNLRGASPRPTWASYWWRTTTPEEVSAPAPWQSLCFWSGINTVRGVTPQSADILTAVHVTSQMKLMMSKTLSRIWWRWRFSTEVTLMGSTCECWS